MLQWVMNSWLQQRRTRIQAEYKLLKLRLPTLNSDSNSAISASSRRCSFGVNCDQTRTRTPGATPGCVTPQPLNPPTRIGLSTEAVI
ncbi:hypothetical protein THARTR1_04360 [Trichoderma harzianum]|uniref:Uncharacterized protein n=1 Tax=Trichoderma harzianum TaxID=5544 RepID=A0A2K0UCM1_TRIHA|nr:hypothetical protein THARTR1_04360 [Trichoderma harzianum]